jgi:tryptophan-rich sensory protein
MIGKLILFLVLNFGALALGGLFTGSGVTSDWYANLNKAPWTPPGWVFGFAWTSIMICFSVYLAQLWPVTENKTFLITLFTLQWILNVVWNPVFFYFHQTGAALLIIVLLTLLVAYFIYHYAPSMKWKTVLISPYFIWLIIATSLNAYAVFKN